MTQQISPDAVWTVVTKELASVWNYYAKQMFGKDVLKAPVISLMESAAMFGCWVPDTREIRMSRAHVLENPWGVTVEILKHEMAHQYVDEVLKVTDETSHGRAFRQVCERFNIDPTASGVKDLTRTEATDHIVEKIQRLLALSKSPNAHEAETAAETARKLMLKYNIDVAEKREAQGYIVRYLGTPVAKISGHLKTLACLLRDYFFVEIIWFRGCDPKTGKTGMYALEISGTPGNVEVAEYLYAFLLREAERLWVERPKGISGRLRAAFFQGVLIGFRTTLKQGRKADEEQGLVWVGDPNLKAFYDTRHTTTRHLPGSRVAGGTAYAAGHAAGKSIQLRGGLTSANSTPLLGGLSPPEEF